MTSLYDESSAADIDFNLMTKAELQAYADENHISGVSSSKQSKAEMIETILSSTNT